MKFNFPDFRPNNYKRKSSNRTFFTCVHNARGHKGFSPITSQIFCIIKPFEFSTEKKNMFFALKIYSTCYWLQIGYIGLNCSAKNGVEYIIYESTLLNFKDLEYLLLATNRLYLGVNCSDKMV